MLVDTAPILEEILDRGDPIERDMTPEEMRAYEVGFFDCLNEEVNKRHFLTLVMKLDGPLMALEIAGMLAGGRIRVLCEAKE